MKKVALLFLLFLAVASAYPQAGQDAPNRALLQQADIMGKAFIAKDYPAFGRFTHPTILALLGGEKNLLEYTTKNFAELEAEGITFLSVSFASPDKILVVDGELQTTLQQMIEMKVAGGTITVTTTLVAVSRDNGKSWYFVDVSGNNITEMRKVIPNLSPALVIPEASDPSFVEDTQKP
jgi:hypothetical protein